MRMNTKKNALNKKTTTQKHKSRILQNSGSNNDPVSISFTEEMKGYFYKFSKSSPNLEDYRLSSVQGKKNRNHIMFHLNIEIPDVDFFVFDPDESGTATGWVDCNLLGGRLMVIKGIFNCFVDYGSPSSNIKHMKYRLFLKNQEGTEYTLSGFKLVQDKGIENIWSDTSTLYTKILTNFVEEVDEIKSEVIFIGVLNILIPDFLKQMTTFKSNGKTFLGRKNAIIKFGKMFFGNLWDIYAPNLFQSEPELWNEREIPLFTLEGVAKSEITTHYVSTDDNISISLFRFYKSESNDVVVLMHGLTTSTDMFIMPEHKNLVNYLHENGFTDIWSLGWRGSLRHNYNLFPHRFTLDDIALFDIPKALHEIRKKIGEKKRIHFIVHCVGSITFFMSLYSKNISGITSVISNSVSLTPKVHLWSKIKLMISPFLMESLFRFPNINPRWSYLPGIARGKYLSKFISLFHKECNNPACHMLSLMWGTGCPACYEHKNLHEITHRRVGDLFGATSMNYYRQIRKSINRNVIVKYKDRDKKYDSLPNNYLEYAKEINVPTLFLTGDKNKVFQDSNVLTHKVLKEINPLNQNELFVAKGYGHQDTLMGKNSDKDIFPIILDFLNRHSKS